VDCPSCKQHFEVISEYDSFCPLCGVKFSDTFKERIKKSFATPINEKEIPPDLSSQHGNDSAGQARISSPADFGVDIDKPNMAKYRAILREVLSDGNITSDNIYSLARIKGELGLNREEAISVQKEVAKELGLPVEETDFLSCDVLLEVDAGRTFMAGDNCILEFRITNTSDDVLEHLCVTGKFMNLDKQNNKVFTKLNPQAHKLFFFPFRHLHGGDEVVSLQIEYMDNKGNPSLYDGHLGFRISDRKGRKEGVKSICNVFNVKHMLDHISVQIPESGQAEKRNDAMQKPVAGSFYTESAKQWLRISLSFNKETTNRKRDEIAIAKKYEEGSGHLRDALKLIEELTVAPLKKKVDEEAINKAMNSFEEAEACFRKIREIDPDHAESLQRIREIEKGIAELKKHREPVVIIQHAPKEVVSSAILTLVSPSKKIFLYSKEVITLGRNSTNDIVLRFLPCDPKENPDNYNKSRTISGNHAEIVIIGSRFCLRDTGRDRKGSTGGTFLNGKRLETPLKEYPLEDGAKINIANVLDLECRYVWRRGKRDSQLSPEDSCLSVVGKVTDSCFGVDKIGLVNAIKIVRLNNYSEAEKYIILVREVTVGRSSVNGIVIDGDQISDIHAKIFYRARQYWIEDLNSRHGTQVNGVAIPAGTEMPLHIKAQIDIGNVSLAFEGRR
jgi:pSer/pThr/pTyr-binding forkhead associated (FHA) protein